MFNPPGVILYGAGPNCRLGDFIIVGSTPSTPTLFIAKTWAGNMAEWSNATSLKLVVLHGTASSNLAISVCYLAPSFNGYVIIHSVQLVACIIDAILAR